MAGTLERLQLLVTSNSTQARGDLASLNKTASSSMGALGKLQEAFKLGAGIGVGAGAVDGVLAGLQKLGTFAVSQFQAAVGAASNLQQATGAVKAIFGDASSTINEFGRDSANAVGLSTAAFSQQAATLGAFLQNMGQTKDVAAATSIALVQVGADLSAAFGGQTSDAVSAIGAALRGERDPIERYGISIKQAAVDAKVLALGLDTSTQAALTNAQATATLALIQQQAASTAGQFGREQDTLAGQQQRFNAELENARAELGAALLPAMTELVKVGRDVIPVIAGVAGAFISAAEAAKTVAKPFVDAGNILRDLTASLPGDPFGKLFGGSDGGAKAKAIGELKEFSSAVFDGQVALESIAPAIAFLPPSLRTLADKFLGIKPAAEAAAAGTKSLADQIAALEKEASGLAGSLFGADKAESAFFKSLETGGSSASSNAKKIERAYRSIEDAQRALADSQKDLDESLISRFLVGLGASSDEITLGQIAERDSTRGLADSKRDLADAQERLNKLREVDAAGLLDAEAAYIQAQRDFVDAEKSNDVVLLNRAKADLIRTEKELGEQRDPSLVGDLAQAEQDVAAAQDAVLKAEIDAVQSRKDLNELINRGKEGSRDLAEANKQVEAAQRRVEESERSLIDAQDALNESAAGLGGSVKTANQRFEEGVSAADTWLQKLIDNKATPEEFGAAVATIYGSLKDVADQAGETKSLDDYLLKISNIYAQLQNINNLPSITATSSANSAENALNRAQSTKIVLNVAGREFGEVVVEGLLAYQSANGSVPIKIR